MGEMKQPGTADRVASSWDPPLAMVARLQSDGQPREVREIPGGAPCALFLQQQECFLRQHCLLHSAGPDTRA